MDPEIRQLSENNLAEMTAFCFRKLASLEANFILLCYRAQQAGIDCSDLVPAGITAIDPEKSDRVH